MHKLVVSLGALCIVAAVAAYVVFVVHEARDLPRKYLVLGNLLRGAGSEEWKELRELDLFKERGLEDRDSAIRYSFETAIAFDPSQYYEGYYYLATYFASTNCSEALDLASKYEEFSTDQEAVDLHKQLTLHRCVASSTTP